MGDCLETDHVAFSLHIDVSGSMQETSTHALACSVDVVDFVGTRCLTPDLDSISQIVSYISIIELLDEMFQSTGSPISYHSNTSHNMLLSRLCTSRSEQSRVS